jgi:hypothetical protein
MSEGKKGCCTTCERWGEREADPIERNGLDSETYRVLVHAGHDRGDFEIALGPDKPSLDIGRVQGNDIVLPYGNVSKKAARLIWRDGKAIVTDLKSTCGTYVDGRKITGPVVLREGAVIYIGDTQLRVVADD